MKKKILTCSITLLLGVVGSTVFAQTNIPVKSIIIRNNSIVPKNQTYYVYDSTGTKLFKVFKGGEKVVLPNRFAYKLRSDERNRGTASPITCVPIPCPDASPCCFKCQ